MVNPAATFYLTLRDLQRFTLKVAEMLNNHMQTEGVQESGHIWPLVTNRKSLHS